MRTWNTVDKILLGVLLASGPALRPAVAQSDKLTDPPAQSAAQATDPVDTTSDPQAGADRSARGPDLDRRDRGVGDARRKHRRQDPDTRHDHSSSRGARLPQQRSHRPVAQRSDDQFPRGQQSPDSPAAGTGDHHAGPRSRLTESRPRPGGWAADHGHLWGVRDLESGAQRVHRPRRGRARRRCRCLGQSRPDRRRQPDHPRPE